MNQDYLPHDHDYIQQNPGFMTVEQFYQIVGVLMQNPREHLDLMTEQHMQQMEQILTQLQEHQQIVDMIQAARLAQDVGIENVQYGEQVLEVQPPQMDIPIVEEDDVGQKLEELSVEEFIGVMALVELQELKHQQELEEDINNEPMLENDTMH